LPIANRKPPLCQLRIDAARFAGIQKQSTHTRTELQHFVGHQQDFIVRTVGGRRCRQNIQMLSITAQLGTRPGHDRLRVLAGRNEFMYDLVKPRCRCRRQSTATNRSTQYVALTRQRKFLYAGYRQALRTANIFKVQIGQVIQQLAAFAGKVSTLFQARCYRGMISLRRKFRSKRVSEFDGSSIHARLCLAA